MAKNDGGLAFPIEYSTFEYHHTGTERTFHHATGMSLRDWFAGMALSDRIDFDPIVVARYAYKVADAMIALRDKEADNG